MKKFTGILFLLAFFINPVLSLAEVVETTSASSVESAVCVSINKSLRYRTSDRTVNSKDVTSLQNFLKEKGYLKVEPNGYFGEGTLQAVKDFQKDNDLVSAGFVGPLTRGLINKYTCPEEVLDTNITSTETTVSSSTPDAEVAKKEDSKEIEDKSKEEKVDTKEENVSSSSAEAKEGNKEEEDKNSENKNTDDSIVTEKKGEEKPPRETFLPKVMFWWGKVNQHIDLNTGTWETDPDGISGANLDYLTYCKKWYPKTTEIKEYKLETIKTWHERYNLNNHTSTKMSYLCVQPKVEDPDNNSYFFKIISPDGGESYLLDESILVTWKNNKASEDKKINISLFYKTDKKEETAILVKDTLNDGEEKISLAVGNLPNIVFGKNFKIYLHADKENGKKEYEDYSKDFFSINKKVENPVVDTGSTPTNPTTPTTPTEPTTPTIPDPASPDPVTPDPAVPVEPTTPTASIVPRISYWWGKVNQHVDASGAWQTDPDGTSGADLDLLTYCQKWYPTTTSVRDYQIETISSWRAAGNTGSYPRTSMSTECVGGSVLGASTEKNPNLCSLNSTLLKGMKSNQVKCLQQKLNQKGYKVVGTAEGKENTQFGYNTMLALKKFQAENSLKADGVLGPQTRLFLNK